MATIQKQSVVLFVRRALRVDAGNDHTLDWVFTWVVPIPPSGLPVLVGTVVWYLTSCVGDSSIVPARCFRVLQSFLFFHEDDELPDHCLRRIASCLIRIKFPCAVGAVDEDESTDLGLEVITRAISGCSPVGRVVFPSCPFLLPNLLDSSISALGFCTKLDFLLTCSRRYSVPCYHVLDGVALLAHLVTVPRFVLPSVHCEFVFVLLRGVVRNVFMYCLVVVFSDLAGNLFFRKVWPRSLPRLLTSFQIKSLHFSMSLMHFVVSSKTWSMRMSDMFSISFPHFATYASKKWNFTAVSTLNVGIPLKFEGGTGGNIMFPCFA